jgi:receptor protein-tyrosine kinase
MTVSAYLRRLVGRWRLIGAIAAAITLAAVVITLTTDTVYVSTAKLYVASAGDDSDLEAVIADGVQVKGRALSYAAVAASEDMARVVAEDVGLDESLSKTAERVHTEVPFATVLINLGVEGSTPEEARAVATSIVEHYNEVLAELETADVGGLAVEVAIVEEPSLPTDPRSPRALLNLLAGLLAGLLVGVGAAVLRDLTDDNVRDAADLRGLGLMPLAVVPAGASASDPGFGRIAVGIEAALSGLAGRKFVIAPCTRGDADPAIGAGLTAALADDDVMVIQCEPTRETGTARAIARNNDGAVLVATAGRTSRTDLREAALELTDVGARVLGVVLRDERRG